MNRIVSLYGFINRSHFNEKVQSQLEDPATYLSPEKVIEKFGKKEVDGSMILRHLDGLNPQEMDPYASPGS